MAKLKLGEFRNIGNPEDRGVDGFNWSQFKKSIRDDKDLNKSEYGALLKARDKGYIKDKNVNTFLDKFMNNKDNKQKFQNKSWFTNNNRNADPGSGSNLVSTAENPLPTNNTVAMPSPIDTANAQNPGRGADNYSTVGQYSKGTGWDGYSTDNGGDGKVNRKDLQHLSDQGFSDQQIFNWAFHAKDDGTKKTIGGTALKDLQGYGLDSRSVGDKRTVDFESYRNNPSTNSATAPNPGDFNKVGKIFGEADWGRAKTELGPKEAKKMVKGMDPSLVGEHIQNKAWYSGQPASPNPEAGSAPGNAPNPDDFNNKGLFGTGDFKRAKKELGKKEAKAMVRGMDPSSLGEGLMNKGWYSGNSAPAVEDTGSVESNATKNNNKKKDGSISKGAQTFSNDFRAGLTGNDWMSDVTDDGTDRPNPFGGGGFTNQQNFSMQGATNTGGGGTNNTYYGNTGMQDFSVNIKGGGRGNFSNAGAAAGYAALNNNQAARSSNILDGLGTAGKFVDGADRMSNATGRITGLDSRTSSNPVYFGSKAQQTDEMNVGTFDTTFAWNNPTPGESQQLDPREFLEDDDED